MPFMSAAAHEPSKKFDVLFEIDKYGRKIPKVATELAGTSDEHEVVLMRGDRYKIKEITEEKDDRYDVPVPKTFMRVKISQIHA